jgi:hypothetical protein
MPRGAKKIATLVVLVAAFLLGISVAQAELTERGDLFVKFNGGIAPEVLPRDARAPISVFVAGTVKTLSGQRPPALRKIEIAINRGGSLDTRGLPTCRRDQLEASTVTQAMAACGPALVGDGRYVGAVALPDQNAFPARGRILAFNALLDGGRAILAHVYDSEPIPTTRIIVFRIHQGGGTFGTVLTGTLPAWLNRYGYVKQISLNLHRTYVHRGRRHSYLGAQCAAPQGFTIGVFAFARASMTFSDGRELSSTLIRSCRVRR